MKDFLVFIDGSPLDEAHLACAEALADRFHAHIDAVVAIELPPLPIAAMDPVAGVMMPFDDETRDTALKVSAGIQSSVEQRLKEKCAHSVSRMVEAKEMLGREIAAAARIHDLFITSLPSKKAENQAIKSCFDAVLTDGCCAILGLPLDGSCNPAFERITIAWNGSKEASRAVAAAMPLIVQAREVVVLLVDQPLRRAGEDVRPGDDIVKHLNRHGVQATLSRVTSADLSISQAILSEVGRTKTQLLVIGAQAEGGLLQWLQGSIARETFAASPIPLLIAH